MLVFQGNVLAGYAGDGLDRIHAWEMIRWHVEILNVKGNGTEGNVLQWNRKHCDYFKGNYLRNKIIAADKGNQKKTP